MQATLNIATNTPTISEEDAHRIACDYVATLINPAYKVPGRAYLDTRAFERQVWRFIIYCADCANCADGLLDALEVDAQTGAVIPLSDDKIRLIHERAMIYAAEQRGVLPFNAQGYVVGEYARRQADRYVEDAIAPFFKAVEPLFIPHYLPRWQVKIVTIFFRNDPLGAMNVDATTGEPIPLTKQQLDQVRERVRAFLASQEQPVAA